MAGQTLQSLFFALLCRYKHGATETEWTEPVYEVSGVIFAFPSFSCWRSPTCRLTSVPPGFWALCYSYESSWDHLFLQILLQAWKHLACCATAQQHFSEQRGSSRGHLLHSPQYKSPRKTHTSLPQLSLDFTSD